MAMQWDPDSGETKWIILYGSWYMDTGEPWEIVTKQIDTIMLRCDRPRNRIGFGFDVVCTPAQIASGKAADMARRILAYIDQHYPGIGLRVVGVTDDEGRRPLRDIWLTRELTIQAIDDVHLFTYE